MKILAIVSLLVVLSAAIKHAAPIEDVAEIQFQAFMQKYNKHYVTQTEYLTRLGIFAQNLKQLRQHNDATKQGTKKVVGGFGITKYFDMSPDEFSSSMLLPKTKLENMPCNIKEKRNTEVLDTSAIPDSWDWRDHGAVTPAKDQGSAGTCWAFSTTGNIEGIWSQKNSLVSLSEEQLNDCDHYDCGVFGGWPCRAFEYVIQTGGLVTEQEYPYCVGTGACYPCPPTGYNETFCGPGPTYCNETKWPCQITPKSKFAASISNWMSLSSDETQLAAQLVKYGPLSVLMDASGFPPLQMHEWGIYEPWSCDPASLDHAVLLVGYGNDDGTNYWIVKNSWGADWGDSGFFKILRGSGTCGINTAATTSVL